MVFEEEIFRMKVGNNFLLAETVPQCFAIPLYEYSGSPEKHNDYGAETLPVGYFQLNNYINSIMESFIFLPQQLKSQLLTLQELIRPAYVNVAKTEVFEGRLLETPNSVYGNVLQGSCTRVMHIP